MSNAIPTTPLEGAVALYGAKLGPNLVDNKLYNVNPNIEVAQNNITETNRQQKMEVQQQQQEMLKAKRTEAAPQTSKPEGAKGNNVDTWA